MLYLLLTVILLLTILALVAVNVVEFDVLFSIRMIDVNKNVYLLSSKYIAICIVSRKIKIYKTSKKYN